MIYTPDQRKQFPEVIGVITLKNKREMIIDVSLVDEILMAINSNDFIYLREYNKTIHKFDVEGISIRETKDKDRDLIMSMLNKKIDHTKNTLSLTQSLEGLKKNYLKK